MRVFLSFFSLMLCFVAGYSQDNSKMLLLDQDIQMESTEAVDAMYNFNFAEAEKKFLELKMIYPDHPMGYFLMGLSNWWKMIPKIEVNDDVSEDDFPQYKIFIAYMDTSIEKGEKMFKADQNKLEASFFLTAAYGLKARFHGETGSYRKAIFEANNCLDYLKVTEDDNELSPEFLFGHGLFNYYEPFIKENYTFLRPVLAFFPNGNKELGMKYLKECSADAFYTRTEAQYFMEKIYFDEDNFEKSYQISRYLSTQYPMNPFFSYRYAKNCFVNGNTPYNEKITAASKIIQLKEQGNPWITDRMLRDANYFMGFYTRYHDAVASKTYLENMVKYSEKCDKMEGAYYVNALAMLGEIADMDKDKDKAKEYYKEVLKVADKKKSSEADRYNQAKAYLDKKNKTRN